ncbi:MAG TPA: phosphate uptake regulator PhoU [Thermoplasmata archaeon]|nr:phosphate uptake regulator PhoU [Thermoplasmata archaeon]
MGLEGRKLQLAGGSTYLVSLPKRWVHSSGLKAGDTIFVETEVDGSVSVRRQPHEKPAVLRKVFDERGEDTRDHLLRKLIGAYISGFGLIEVRFHPPRGPFVRRVAREFCHLVIGPEVIEETRTALVIQDLSDTSELNSEKCLRRMHLIVRAMLEDAVLALKTGGTSLAHDVAQRDQDVDRLYWMVAKQYHMARPFAGDPEGRGASAEIQGHCLVAKLLERIGDHAERIAGTLGSLGPGKSVDGKLMKELEETTASAVSILDKSFGALIAHDIEAANEAIDRQADHQRLIDQLTHHVAPRKGEELLALGTIVDSLSRTARYSADIAEQAINMAVVGEAAHPKRSAAATA